MPSASANISAKFIAQIEMSAICAPIQSEPAAATSPRIVSISGSPAATSEPNASTRIASVTGHEISSDFIIADLFASLKSDHMPGRPGEVDLDAVGAELRERVLELAGGAHHLVRVARRARPDHGGVAIGRDRAPAATATVAIAGSALSLAATARRVCPERGIGDGLVGRVDDDQRAVAAQPGEVGVDQPARVNGLGTRRLPTGSGQRGLGPWREEPETQRDDDPCRDDDAEMCRRPAAEPSEVGPTVAHQWASLSSERSC